MEKWLFHRGSSFSKSGSSLLLFFIFLFYLACFHTLLSPKSAPLQEKELSIALASTDIPPFSVAESLKNAIFRAKKSIKVAIYALQDRSIIAALKRAQELNGIHIEIVVDPSATENGQFLLGPHITLYERALSGLMHSKLIVIDESETWYGTMNFTKSSLVTHGNMACGIKSSIVAQRAIEYINSLIQEKKFDAEALYLTSEDEGGPRIFFAFHPSQAKRSYSELIQRIDRAKSRVFVAMYTFTHHEIAQALIRAKKRGIDVRVLFDRDSSRETSGKIYALLLKNGVYSGTRKKKGLLHYKCALIDSSFVIGSCNWTKAAFSHNAETFSIIDSLPQDLQTFIIKWWNAIESDSTITESANLPRLTTFNETTPSYL